MKAYLVTIPGWERHFVIYAARSHGHAKSGDYQALKEVGYKPAFAYTELRVRRLPQFDKQAQQYTGLHGPVCIGWREGRDSWGLGDQRIEGFDQEE